MLPALFGIVRRTEFSSIANQQTVLSSFLNDNISDNFVAIERVDINVIMLLISDSIDFSSINLSSVRLLPISSVSIDLINFVYLSNKLIVLLYVFDVSIILFLWGTKICIKVHIWNFVRLVSRDFVFFCSQKRKFSDMILFQRASVAVFFRTFVTTCAKFAHFKLLKIWRLKRLYSTVWQARIGECELNRLQRW